VSIRKVDNRLQESSDLTASEPLKPGT